MVGINLFSCKTWDDRLMTTGGDVSLTLADKIANQAELSTFNSLLQKTGYDKLLASSKNFTVWAPTNTALASLSTNVLNDTTALKAFVGNYLAFQSMEMLASATGKKLVPLINGKYATLQGNTFNGLATVSTNTFVGNGVLHTLSSSADVLPSLWQYVQSNTTLKQNNAINSLIISRFNPDKAEKVGIDPLTGVQLYKSTAPNEQVNRFTTSVANLADESKRYTYIVLADAAYDSEIARVTGYFKAGGDTTTKEATFNVVKDLLVQGEYTADNLPTSFTSTLGTKFSIDKSAVVSTVKLSNGIALVVNKINLALSDKFKSFVAEGENYAAKSDLANNLTTATIATVFAVKDYKDPNTGRAFQQIRVFGHGVTGYWLKYSLSALPAMKYKVYWVAVNDLYNSNTATAETATLAISQRLLMGSLTSTTFAMTALTAKNYSEVYLGDYTTSKYGSLDMYLVSNTTGGLMLDYIRLEPSL